MSKPLSSTRYAELLSGEMVVITVGDEENKARFYVHRDLPNSVTKAFSANCSHVKSGFGEDLKHFEFPTEDAEVFKMFLSWLYNNHRTQEMKTQCYNINSLLDLHDLSISMYCDTLKSDTLYALLAVLNKNANTFVETVVSKLLSEAQTDQELHEFLGEISRLPTLELDFGPLLNLYVETVKWNNENWQNYIIDSIREKLYNQREVLDFDQVSFVFEGTKKVSPNNDQLRKFCSAMVYYQRNGEEGQIKPGTKLGARVMERLLRDIDGFMIEYLKFEDEYHNQFPGELPKNPRPRNGELGNCYFHLHEWNAICSGGMDLDA